MHERQWYIFLRFKLRGILIGLVANNLAKQFTSDNS